MTNSESTKRKILRENGIRVSNHLTKRQRQKLNERDKKHIVYFHKGKVHTKQRKPRNKSSRSVVKIVNDGSSKPETKGRRVDNEGAHYLTEFPMGPLNLLHLGQSSSTTE